MPPVASCNRYDWPIEQLEMNIANSHDNIAVITRELEAQERRLTQLYELQDVAKRVGVTP